MGARLLALLLIPVQEVRRYVAHVQALMPVPAMLEWIEVRLNHPVLERRWLLQAPRILAR